MAGIGSSGLFVACTQYCSCRCLSARGPKSPSMLTPSMANRPVALLPQTRIDYEAVGSADNGMTDGCDRTAHANALLRKRPGGRVGGQMSSLTHASAYAVRVW